MPCFSIESTRRVEPVKTFVNTGLIAVLTGEVSTTAQGRHSRPLAGGVDSRQIGYKRSQEAPVGTMPTAMRPCCGHSDQQSPDIAQGVDEADDHAGDRSTRVGAGDKASCFGLRRATETPEF